MKYCIILFILISPIRLLSQNYNLPESVDFDSLGQRYLISNSGTGEILSYNPSTDVLDLFVSNVGSGPHGLEVIENEVFACSGSRLKAYNLVSGQQSLNVNLGAGFANGITHKGTDVFVTDFGSQKIYRYDITTGSFYVFVNNFPYKPNGIFYDFIQDRLMVVCWGSNAPIYEINLSDSTYTIATNTNLNNCDGIAMDGNGDFYVSAWSNNAITKFNSDFSGTSTVVVNNMDNPADIYYNTESDTLAIPNSGSNTVVFIGFSNITSYTCDNSTCVELTDDSGEYSSIEDCQSFCEIVGLNDLTEHTFYVFPNPTNSQNKISINPSLKWIELYTLQGKKRFQKQLSNSSTLQLPYLESGLYLLVSDQHTEKIIIQ